MEEVLPAGQSGSADGGKLLEELLDRRVLLTVTAHDLARKQTQRLMVVHDTADAAQTNRCPLVKKKVRRPCTADIRLAIPAANENEL